MREEIAVAAPPPEEVGVDDISAAPLEPQEIPSASPELPNQPGVILRAWHQVSTRFGPRRHQRPEIQDVLLPPQSAASARAAALARQRNIEKLDRIASRAALTAVAAAEKVKRADPNSDLHDSLNKMAQMEAQLAVAARTNADQAREENIPLTPLVKVN